MNCPECNTKLRKFKEGVICNKNHKFLKGSVVYNKFYNIDTHIENDLDLSCPICGEIGHDLHCMCGECGVKCSNGHIWNPNLKG
jgi:hypothetical protein